MRSAKALKIKDFLEFRWEHQLSRDAPDNRWIADFEPLRTLKRGWRNRTTLVKQVSQLRDL
jgi:hypothetical protein